MRTETVIDAAAFLSMHACDPVVRENARGFFAGRPTEPLIMSQEHIGICDDIVWSYPRHVQDAYYPFMDVLHSEWPLLRVGYEEADIRIALGESALEEFPMHERLVLGMVLRRRAVLVTGSPRLRGRADLPVRALVPARAGVFPEHLERLYGDSQLLRVPEERL
jgi:hypothetical protein